MRDLGAAWKAAMRSGRLAAAWAISDRVLASRDPLTRDDPTRPYHQRWVWDGRRFAGEHVLVRCYHGLGDTIQNMRFLPMLAEQARSVTVEVQPELFGLLAHFPGIDRLVPFWPKEPHPPSACDIEITELPHALRVTSIAAEQPYLHAAAMPVASNAIGFCHCTGEWDTDRRIPEKLLTALCRGRDAYSLVPQASELPVLNPAGCGNDVVTTASLVASLGTIVTVDTMIAHLAGALGRPTWVLLKHDPDWRWEPRRSVSRWYPTLTMLRQVRPGDWTGVIGQLERMLSAEGASASQEE